jgi:hypothetical protein
MLLNSEADTTLNIICESTIKSYNRIILSNVDIAAVIKVYARIN